MNIKQWLFAKKIIGQAYESKLTTGLPASILAAQCILETGWGKYIPIDIETGKFSYNLFGIKGTGTNGSVDIYTHEYIKGEKVRIIAKFRAYHNYVESFTDYGNLILGNPRYKKAVAVKNNPREYIRELWLAGYATDINYPAKVIQIAEQCKFIPKVKV